MAHTPLSCRQPIANSTFC